ncbi:hypothetical protein WME79_29035 [Sorangium sp. So ce726]|uniref:hypothetical protein n=1 Tax=Sorangium sp. So ce726 TaxID=3133319 RepID=UPI003F63E9A5
MEQHAWKRPGPRRLAITSILLVAGALAFASRASADHDEDNPRFRFTNADFRGRYAASFQGQAGPFQVAAEGFFVADGTGNITLARRTSSVGGTILRQTFMCTYDVEPDGTGSADCTTNDGMRELYDFVLERQGNGVLFIRTPVPDIPQPNFVVLGSATRK